MDTNNLDKWWHGLPENTRQAIGDDGIWEKLDMPSALHRYSLLRIYGTAKDRDEERTLLNEIACGLGDLALVCKNGIALEEVWKSIPTEESRKLSMFSVVGCTSTQARTCLTTSYRNRTVSDWGVLRYALPKRVKAPSWELTVPGSF